MKLNKNGPWIVVYDNWSYGSGMLKKMSVGAKNRRKCYMTLCPEPSIGFDKPL
jgi:hypothetical protein